MLYTWMNAEPSITTRIAGKMKNARGKMSLMVVLAAASSANCRPLRPQGVGMDPKSQAETGAEFFRLCQHDDKGFHVVNHGPVSHVLECIDTRFARPRLPRCNPDFLCQRVLFELRRLGYPYECGVQTESGLDADGQKIMNIRKGVEDLGLSLVHHIVQPVARQQETDDGQGDRDEQWL